MHANIFVVKEIGWLVKLFPTAVVRHVMRDLNESQSI